MATFEEIRVTAFTYESTRTAELVSSEHVVYGTTVFLPSAVTFAEHAPNPIWSCIFISSYL